MTEQPKAKTTEQRIEAVESVLMELIGKVEEMSKGMGDLKKTVVTKPKGLFGGKRTPTPQKDLKTGAVYASKAAVGKLFAVEAGADPANTMAWYTVLKVLKMPDGSDRFVDASAEEGAKARADAQAKIDAEVAATNARLEAEREAEAKKAGGTAPAAAAAPVAPTKPIAPAKKK